MENPEDFDPHASVSNVITFISSEGRSEYVGLVSKPVNIRLNVSAYTKLKAMAEDSGFTPTRLATWLLEAAINEGFSAYPKDLEALITTAELKDFEEVKGTDPS